MSHENIRQRGETNMNPMLILQLKPAWEQFKGSHPKLLNFIKAASKDSFLDKGSLIEISVTNSAGKTIASNIRVKEDDLAFLSALKDVLEDTQV